MLAYKDVCSAQNGINVTFTRLRLRWRRMIDVILALGSMAAVLGFVVVWSIDK
jgi:hypothetical protein